MRKSVSSYAALTAACAGAAAYFYVVRPWHLGWGATEEEARAPLPGDEFVKSPNVEATHAVTVDGIKRRAEALRQCLGKGSRRHVRVAGEQW